MFYTIYKVTNTINGKIYIGKHQTQNMNDNYMGSGKTIREAIKKYGKDSFVKEILFVFNNEAEMNECEKSIITEEFVNRADTYNIGIGGEGGPHFKGRKHTLETRQKITESNLNREHGPYTGERLKKRIADNKNPERRKKVSEGLKGKPKTPEHKEKIRQSLLKRRGAVTQLAECLAHN